MTLSEKVIRLFSPSKHPELNSKPYGTVIKWQQRKEEENQEQ
jgi:hypothetical protein